ncbi:MAG: hypothetical protein P8Y25_09180 [Chromatiaceae bacterium]
MNRVVMISLPLLRDGTPAMWLSVAGLLIASLVAMVCILTSAGRMPKKLSLGFLALAGLVVGLSAVVIAEQSQRENASSRAAETQQLKGRLEAADAVIKELRNAQAEQEPLIRYISASLGDLRLLSKLTAGRTYCVRIAAAGTESGRAELEDIKQRIASEFPGAAASGMLAIVPFSRQYNTVQLVFGRGLSFAAAEVFLRLARTHHFANARPRICAEPSAHDAKKSDTQ